MVGQSIPSVGSPCAGAEGTLAHITRAIAENIRKPMCHIINDMVERSFYSRELNEVRVVATEKVKSPHTPKVLRPISVLPFSNKVQERWGRCEIICETNDM